MKAGVRALGVAESYQADTSTLGGAVVRADRVVDGFVFGQCTVGASDATASVIEMIERLDRPDVQYVLVAGIAPAWYNILDIRAISESVDRPVLSVSFADSDGLEPALRSAFAGEALTERLTIYRDQPERQAVELDGETVYVRAVGCSDSEAKRIVRAFTPEGGRPEPLRVARAAARAVETVRRES